MTQKYTDKALASALSEAYVRKYGANVSHQVCLGVVRDAAHERVTGERQDAIVARLLPRLNPPAARGKGGAT